MSILPPHIQAALARGMMESDDEDDLGPRVKKPATGGDLLLTSLLPAAKSESTAQALLDKQQKTFQTVDADNAANEQVKEEQMVDPLPVIRSSLLVEYESDEEENPNPNPNPSFEPNPNPNPKKRSLLFASADLEEIESIRPHARIPSASTMFSSTAVPPVVSNPNPDPNPEYIAAEEGQWAHPNPNYPNPSAGIPYHQTNSHTHTYPGTYPSQTEAPSTDTAERLYTEKDSRRRDRFVEEQLLAGNVGVLQHANYKDVGTPKNDWDPLKYGEKQRQEFKAASAFNFGQRGKDNMIVQPTRLMNRKHQIHALAFKAYETELELLEDQGRRNKTKAQTHAKYGW